MDEARYRFRKHLDVDYVAEVRVSHRLNPERRHTVDELRRWTTMLETPPFFFRRYVVEDLSSGVAVGFGGVYTDLDVQDPSRLWVDVVVDPDHQGRGIGRALAEKAEEEAWGAKAVAVLAQARSDRPRDMEFVTRRGTRNGAGTGNLASIFLRPVMRTSPGAPRNSPGTESNSLRSQGRATNESTFGSGCTAC